MKTRMDINDTNINIKKGKIINIKDIDINNSFLHYTHKSNIESIMEKGLLPKIGKNSRNIELNKKVFFTVGFDNTLILIDAWLKWLILKPKNNFVYKCGCFYMKHRIFPRFVVDLIFKKSISNGRKIKYAYKKLDGILENSVFLKLDLVENVDFSYKDTDEVKKQNFSRKQLSYIYTYENTIDERLELWNMHTLKDKVIESSKINLIKFDDTYCAKDVILYMVKVSKLNLKDICPVFYGYLKNRKLI